MNFVNLLVINKSALIKVRYYILVPLLFDLYNVVQLSKVGPVQRCLLWSGLPYYSTFHD